MKTKNLMSELEQNHIDTEYLVHFNSNHNP